MIREKQLDTIHDEIKREHKKLEGVRKEIEAELQVVMEKLELLEARSGSVDKARKEADARLDEFDQKITKMKPAEMKNTKQAATIHERMEPEAAANSIHQMVEKGESLSLPVAILDNMRERQAAAPVERVGQARSRNVVPNHDALALLQGTRQRRQMTRSAEVAERKLSADSAESLKSLTPDSDH